MTDLTRARELIALAQELDAKATPANYARLLAEQIAATEAAEREQDKVIERMVIALIVLMFIAGIGAALFGHNWSPPG